MIYFRHLRRYICDEVCVIWMINRIVQLKLFHICRKDYNYYIIYQAIRRLSYFCRHINYNFTYFMGENNLQSFHLVFNFFRLCLYQEIRKLTHEFFCILYAFL